MKRITTLLLILMMLFSAVPVSAASDSSAPTVKLSYTKKIVHSSKKNYVTGKISAANGQRVVLYDANGTAISLQRMGTNGLPQDFKLPAPDLKKGPTVFVVRAESIGNIPASNAVTIILDYRSVKASDYSSTGASGGGSSTDPVQDAIDWAIKIANDDSFCYGRPGPGKGPGQANRTGCYFCGTNDKKVKASGGDKRYYKTYMCQAYVLAAYAHGAKDPDMLKLCRTRGKKLECTDAVWRKHACWDFVGRAKNLSLSDLKPGDVFVTWDTHMAMYIGNGDTIDAHSSDCWGASSIAIRKGGAKRFLKHRDKSFVMRYVGNGSGKTQVSIVGNQRVISGALAWARKIAADDSYTYGHGSFNCCICHKMKIRKFTCMPFVAAAYAHGGKDPIMMGNGRHVINLHDGNFQGDLGKIWRKVGLCKDLTIKDLQPGDVVIKWSDDNAHGHAWMYGGGDEIIEATSGEGIHVINGAAKRLKSYGTSSKRGKNYVMRYVGAQ